ncbi:MAG TPA: response regulator [Candidatus Sulfopaludibacter sp.]|nr:response regulator [Candidatus Sulfopaludibacter sp.]
MFSCRLASMSQPESNGVTGSPPTIYVVDDEQILLDLAEMVLEPAGFEVCLFRDPLEALAEYTAAQSPPDVLVTDYAMGRMNGMDLIRECKRLNPQQKTILLSGTVDESIYADSPVRPDHFLAKPYQIKKLVEVIRSLLAQ